ncbi:MULTISPECIES: ABC transporter permease [Fusobacterium]|jgi:iron(III) transport system permease protein|uniref:Iron ABC transporter permease n=1 Tax=Fusobacterium varium ATCC 27725 TaxID=469618 RepID=A0ABN5JKD5_FUSVA|nr:MULTISPECIES: iron ABC transporter permease [Fusobacterium]AVQ32165.1 iron ABC transporter permease [Fusobacterium varium ATCC 27725]EES63852.1 ABC transporter, permease protein [Fusobacterium varium ATCC 27725]MCF0170331.1 iron ABC transporter permease [Fusobacterium varium]MCF2672732.1 iron ABC transporter permease [Fusobacterium varium]MCI6031280.1 iron ABC transporter permease [Fusobacterium varium]
MSNLQLKINTELKNMKKVFNDPILFSTIVFILVILIMFILFPMYNILKESFTYKGEFSLIHYKNIKEMQENFIIILNTLKLGVVTSVISTAIGFFFAYGMTYVKIPFRKFFNSIAILPIVSPPFVIALSAILLLGRRGFITRNLLGIRNAEIYGFHGLVLVQVLTFFPVAYLMLVGLLQKIDPSVEEASRDLGASRWDVFRTITFPLMIPGLANAILVIFIQAIADFGNPMVIGGNFTTVAVQIYLQGIGNYDMGSATALAVVLILMSISIFVTQKYYISKKSYVTVTGKVSREREKISEKNITMPIFIIMAFLTFCVFLMYIMIPIGSFVKLWGVKYDFSLEHYKYVFALGMKPIWDTTFLSIISTPITGILAMIIAFLIVRRKFLGKGFIEFITMMAIAIPGTIVGLGYIITYNTKPFVLTGTATILIIAFIMRNMPIGIRSGIAALQQIDPSIEEAATVLGANSKKVFTSVTLPMIKPAFFSGLVYAFVRSMTLVSTIIFLVSAKYNLLTVAIMNQIDVGKIGVASAYCTILIIIVFFVIGIMTYILKKMGIDSISE